MHERKVLLPEYMLKFECIGAACEDTCCAGWQVHVDRETYDIYKQLKDPALQQMFDHHVVPNPRSTSEQDYGLIKFNEDQRCPAMTTEGWCSIHMKYGQQALGMTCANYPRSFMIVDGIVEKSGTTSCPEIARLALLNKEGISFVETTEDFLYSFGVYNKLENDGNSDRAENYFWDLRVFAIRVLQERKFPLAERMLLLGLFCQKLDDNIRQGANRQIPALIEQYGRFMHMSDFQSLFARLPRLPEVQISLLKMLLDMRLNRFGKNKRLHQFFEQSLAGLKIVEGDEIESIVEKYVVAYDNYYRHREAEFMYIFENYFVNHVFRTGFPFDKNYRKRSVFAEFVLMAVHFSLIRFVLVGLLAYHGEQSDEQLVASWFQVFSKSIDHSGNYVHEMMDLMYKNNFTTMGHMSVLLKM